MIADVSHDLKTLLTMIKGYAKAFYDGRVPDDKKDLYLQAMNDKSLIASELLDTLFEYAQMEHPEYQADKKTSTSTSRSDRVTIMIWAVSALCLISCLHGLEYRGLPVVRLVMFSG